MKMNNLKQYISTERGDSTDSYKTSTPTSVEIRKFSEV